MGAEVNLSGTLLGASQPVVVTSLRGQLVQLYDSVLSKHLAVDNTLT